MIFFLSILTGQKK